MGIKAQYIPANIHIKRAFTRNKMCEMGPEHRPTQTI